MELRKIKIKTATPVITINCGNLDKLARKIFDTAIFRIEQIEGEDCSLTIPVNAFMYSCDAGDYADIVDALVQVCQLVLLRDHPTEGWSLHAVVTNACYVVKDGAVVLYINPNLKDDLLAVAKKDKSHGKVKYTGACNDQIYAGMDDPRSVLTEGDVYEVIKTDVHSWHEELTLAGFETMRFNSVCFEEVKESTHDK
jgi:hypothetical protein